MQKYLLFGLGGLIVGVAIGFFAANRINRDALVQTTAPPANSAAAHAPQGAVPGPEGGMIPDVAEAIDKAKNEPQNLEAQLKVADMYWKIDKFDKAAEFYSKAVGIKPADFELNIRLANAYFESKQFENAETFYTKALEINPKDIDARTDLGTTFVERQTPDLDRAMQEFEKSLALDPKHQPTLFNMAVIYSKKGDPADVKKMLARLEAIDPNSQYVSRLRQADAPK